MSYPFVLAVNDESIARVNFDGTWSVRWDRVAAEAYARPHPRHIAVMASAKLLMAAKDNFVLTPWEVSEQSRDKWTHFQSDIDYIDHDPKRDRVQSTISYNGDLIAQVNYDGSWSVLWEQIEELSRLVIDDFRGVALVAICRLFMAAKDRFWTTPWVFEDEDEDDE
jgi:hypothetical protein